MQHSILIIEDDDNLREVLRFYLEEENYLLFDAADGASAREIIEKEIPDLVLLDLRLPDESGISILRWMREVYPSIQTIIVSGAGSIGLAVESVKLGAFDYVQKPVDPEPLKVMVRSALPKPTKKLAAIIFTDIVGYSALSAKDEQKAFDLIRQQRSILQPLVKEYGGRWLKEMGDGILMSFDSSTQAVRCAINMQKSVENVESLNLRIGIHQGDIMEEEGDIHGDDVNVASRLEPLAPVGGIVISDKVQRDILSEPDITTKFLGEPQLKGVKQEVKVFCITSHDLPEATLS